MTIQRFTTYIHVGSSFERHDAIDLPDDDEFVTDDTPAKIDALC